MLYGLLLPFYISDLGEVNSCVVEGPHAYKMNNTGL